MSNAATRGNTGCAVMLSLVLSTLRITADTQAMDLRVSTDVGVADNTEPAQAVLAAVTCRWGDDPDPADDTTAAVVHASRDMLILEATNPRQAFPPLGTLVHVSGDIEHPTGRLAEQGRAGRFLVSLGNRPVRQVLRLRVCLAGTLRCATLPEPTTVEIVDLTTGGARLRGVELAVGSHVTFDFTPPGRDQSVTVRALVAHRSNEAKLPWIGVVFRLVAMHGGRSGEPATAREHRADGFVPDFVPSDA
jgi:hypothetical protein